MRFSLPGSSQVQGHPLHFSEGGRCSCLARRDRSPPGEGCDRAGPSSRYEDGFYSPYFIVPKKGGGLRPILDLRASLTGPFTSFRSRCSRRNVSSDASVPEIGAAIDLKDAYFHVSILSVPQAIPAVCVRRTGISVQGPALRAVPVAPCLHESCGGSPCSHERTGCSHSQLPRRLAHTGSVSGQVVRTQGLGAFTPQPVGPSGQLGKEQTLPDAEDLFSRHGVGFGQSDSTPHAGTCSVGVELLEYVQEQDSGPTETISEAPGAYGSYGGSHAVGAASYETASTLASWPNPEVGVAMRHSPGPSHNGLPPNPHPVVRPFVPSGRSAPGTGLQACCGLHRCLHHWLGCHVQRACSVGGLDGPPTALAHQLPRVAGSTPGLDPPQEPPTRRARTGPHGQHCDRCVHQPTRWSTLPSHVATRPPPRPLESEASEVASCHSHSGLAQPGS